VKLLGISSAFVDSIPFLMEPDDTLHFEWVVTSNMPPLSVYKNQCSLWQWDIYDLSQTTKSRSLMPGL